MHPLAKRIVLLVSIFSLVAGLFLLGYNLSFFSRDTMTTVLNFWPLLLVAAGFLMLFDSTKRRVFAHATGIATRHFPLPLDDGCTELSCSVQFSYGTLTARDATGPVGLTTEQPAPSVAPTIAREVVGARNAVSVAMTQPLFPSQPPTPNVWTLELPNRIPLRIAMKLHEAELL
ncbi:MAG TPA: hypothetical protein VHE79_14815, partial [Spirochaetia bacterium]